MKWFSTGVLFLLGLVANGQTVRLEDRSDWWSMNNEKESILSVERIEKKFDTRNFTILGLSLETLGFDQVAAKLGKATIVNRGDASYSRSQLCYMSASDLPRIYLVFEGGEGGSSTFYLFRGGPGWKGSNFCVKSNRVSTDLTTATGLKLGLSRGEVEAILGKPDTIVGDRIAYLREFQQKQSRRESGSSASDQEAHKKTDLVPVSMQIEARFHNQQLNYLFVSTVSQSGD